MSKQLSSSSTAGGSLSADEAFGLLSNSNRIDILRVVWELTDPLDPQPITYSDIRERVEINDPGKLNYHLKKLRGHFIRHTEDGYVLREEGRRIVRVLISGTVGADPTIESVEISARCVFCSAPTKLSYQDGYRVLECTRCNAQCVDSYPDGVLSLHEFPPSGVIHRSPEEIHEADLIWAEHRRASVIDGICPDCAGPMPVTSVHICENHAPGSQYDEVCDRCSSIFRTEVTSICEICESVWKMPVQFHVANHPDVVAFYFDHGIEFRLSTYEHRAYLLTYREQVISEDPLRIRTTIPLKSDELHVTVDSEMNVVGVRK